MPRERGDAARKFVVRDGRIAVHHGDGAWRARRLGGEARMHAFRFRGRRGTDASREEIGMLRRIKERESRDRPRRVFGDRGEQRLEVARHPLDRRSVEQVPRVTDAADELPVAFAKRDRQVELGMLARHVDPFRPHARSTPITGRRVLQDERHLEERMPRRLARRGELEHDLLER